MVQLVDHQAHVFLGLLAHGDVEGRPDDADAAAGVVEDAAPLGRDPAQPPVLLADGPVVHVVEGAHGRIHGRLESRPDPVQILRVHLRIEIRHRDGLFRRDAEHGLHPRRPEQHAGDEVEIPQPHLGGLGGQPQLLLAAGQRFAGPLGLGDVEAFAEDAADLAGVVEHRGVDEVQQPFAHLSGLRIFQAGGHVMGDGPLAGGVGPVEHFEEALALQFGEGFPDRLAYELSGAEQRPVGLVDELEHMVRAGEGADEARRLRKQALLALLLLGCPSRRQDPVGGLHHRAEHAGHSAGLIAHRRIGESEPGLLLVAAPLQHQRQIFAIGRLARQSRVDQRDDVGPDLRPDVLEAGAQGGRMLDAEALRIGVVVEEAELGSPRDEHGELGIEQQSHHRAQRLRPALRRSERGCRPVVRAHQRADGAAPGQERQIRRGAAIEDDVAQEEDAQD